MSRSKRRKSRKHRKKKRRGQNRHHMIPKARHGSSHPSNILWMHIERHACWHKIFGLRTIPEIIELLERIERMKRRQL